MVRKLPDDHPLQSTLLEELRRMGEDDYLAMVVLYVRRKLPQRFRAALVKAADGWRDHSNIPNQVLRWNQKSLSTLAREFHMDRADVSRILKEARSKGK